jgi:hypothetical protein
MQSKIHYVFGGTPYTAGDSLDFWWYDGQERPPQAVVDAVGGKIPSSGVVIIGTDGAILLPHIAPPVLFPTARFADRPLPAVTARNHYHEFLDAVASGPGTRCSASFDYASLLTEVVLLGTLACHQPSQTLAFDANAMKFEGRVDNGHGFARSYRRKYLTP